MAISFPKRRRLRLSLPRSSAGGQSSAGHGRLAPQHKLNFVDLRIEKLSLHPVPAVCVLGRRGD
jgi:hypothetical protein